MTRRYSLFEILLAIFFITVTLYGAFSDAHNFPRNWFDRDDAYYYFKVAQNITEGHGITFDGVDRTNGYHPLWMIVCIPIFALARFDLILPLRVLFFVMGLLYYLTSIYLFRLLKRVVAEPVAMLAAALWAFNYTISLNVYQQGLETGIAAFLIVLTLYVLSQKEEKWQTQPATRRDIAEVAILAVLVMFSRLDLVFLAGLLGLRVVFRKSPMRDLLGLDLLFVMTSVLASFVLRLDVPQYYSYSKSAFTLIFLSALVRIPALFAFGLYGDIRSLKPIQVLTRIGMAVLTSSLIIVPVMLLASSALHLEVFPRITLIYDLVIFSIFILLSRFSYLWFAEPSSSSEEQRPIQYLQQNFAKWLADGAVYYGIVLGSLVVYMLFNQLTFGTSSPVSGQVKRWWGTYLTSKVYGGVPAFKLDFYGINPESEYNAWPLVSKTVLSVMHGVFQYIHWNTWWHYRYGWTFVGVLLVCAVLFSLQKRYTADAFSRIALIPLLASAGFQLFSYNAGGYAGVKEWYWITQHVSSFILFALLVDLFARHLAKYKTGLILLWLLAISIPIPRAAEYVRYVKKTMPHNEIPASEPYMEAVPFLEAHTPPGSMIGLTGGGNAGYFIHDRTVVNMDGLINSYEYFKALKSRTAAQYLAGIGLDYIFANPELLDGAPYHGQFNELYEISIDRFGGKVLIKLKQDVK